MAEELPEDKPMATPAYRAWAKREAAIRDAKAQCWKAIQSAYRELERAEQQARGIHDAELRQINRETVAAWNDARKVA